MALRCRGGGGGQTRRAPTGRPSISREKRPVHPPLVLGYCRRSPLLEGRIWGRDLGVDSLLSLGLLGGEGPRSPARGEAGGASTVRTHRVQELVAPGTFPAGRRRLAISSALRWVSDRETT